MMPHGHQMASKCDSELSLPQERVKYVVVSNPKAVVGTSTALYERPCACTAPKDHGREIDALAACRLHVRVRVACRDLFAD